MSEGIELYTESVAAFHRKARGELVVGNSDGKRQGFPFVDVALVGKDQLAKCRQWSGGKQDQGGGLHRFGTKLIDRRIFIIFDPSSRRRSHMPRKGSNFFEDVYEVVKLVPRGRVTSYGA